MTEPGTQSMRNGKVYSAITVKSMISSGVCKLIVDASLT